MHSPIRSVLALTLSAVAALGAVVTAVPTFAGSTSTSSTTSVARRTDGVRSPAFGTAPTTRSTATVTNTLSRPASTLPLGVSIIGTEMLFSSDAEQGRYLDQIAATGATWVRFDLAAPQFTWDDANQYYWAGLDKAVAGAQKRNLKVLGILHMLPVYARPKGAPANHGPATAAERSAFAKYSATLAKRYAGRISAYEVWNEPNQKTFWSPAPNVAHYSALLAATSSAIKAVDSRAVILTGGVGGIGAGSADVDAMTWLSGVYARTNRSAFNAVAVHAYPNLASQTDGELGTFAYYRRLLDSKGDTTKQLWLTETGAPTGGQLSTDQSGQARFMGIAYTNWRQQHHAGPLFFYTLNDRRGTDRENYFGMVTTTGVKKKSYTTMQQIAAGNLG